MKLSKKKPQPQKSQTPRPITISDILEYHRDKDSCYMCKSEHGWDCPRHPHNPHNPPRYRNGAWTK